MDLWPAPAKLNLFLHVTGRRADGYHTLQTVFQFLDFGDSLRFDLTQDGSVGRYDALAGVSVSDDLCLRAAQALKKVSGTTAGAMISLVKRLPMGAGLGGGSSDAATTLVALNELWSTSLDTDTLAEIGLSLGADVPVFVRGLAAWGEGIGEQLTPIELPEPYFLVMTPSVMVSTASVFGASELTRDTPAITIRAFRAGCGRNDLEPVVRARYPAVDAAFSWLEQYGAVRMSGSGASIFVEMGSGAEAEAALAAAPAGLSGFVARGLNRSPLLARLEAARQAAG